MTGERRKKEREPNQIQNAAAGPPALKYTHERVRTTIYNKCTTLGGRRLLVWSERGLFPFPTSGHSTASSVWPPTG